MAYERTIWENGVTPINATNLNNIEDGIEEAMVEDTGWVECTRYSGIGISDGATPEVRRIGNQVFVRGRVTATWDGKSSTVPLITIPAGFRPPLQFYKNAQCSSWYMAKLWFSASGRVGIDHVTDYKNDVNITTQIWIDLANTWLID